MQQPWWRRPVITSANVSVSTREQQVYFVRFNSLTHWGRVTHICVGNLTIIGSDNGLSPERRQAITWTNAGLLLTGPLGKTSVKSYSEFKHFHSGKCTSKCRLRNGVHFVSASIPLVGNNAHERDGLSNHRQFYGLFNRFLRPRDTGNIRTFFTSQESTPKSSNAESVSMLWGHYGSLALLNFSSVFYFVFEVLDTIHLLL